MIDTAGAIVGVVVIAGAIGLFVFRGGLRARLKSRLWKIIGLALLVLIIVGYLRAHSPKQ